jgi:L-aspartate oxidase
LLELRNILTVSELIVECALRRKESRGLHYTVDYPHTLEREAHDTVI